MSLVEVFAVEPVTATTFALLRDADLARDPGESGEGVLREKRCRGAGLQASSAKSTPAPDRDEEVARLDAPRVDGHAGDGSPAPGLSSPVATRPISSRVERDHARAASRRRALARDLPVVEGDDPVGELLSLLVAFAGDDDDVPLPGPLERGCDRRLAVGLDLRIAGHPGDDLVDDRLRVLAPRVVGRDDRRVGEAGGDVAHERPLAPVAVAAAAEDATRRPAVISRASVRTFSSASGVCA